MKITGTVAVVTNGSGRVIVSLADFGQNRPGGFKVQEAQKARLRDAVAMEVIRATCAEDIYRVITAMEARGIFCSLCEYKGWCVSYKEALADFDLEKDVSDD